MNWIFCRQSRSLKIRSGHVHRPVRYVHGRGSELGIKAKTEVQILRVSKQSGGSDSDVAAGEIK